MSRQRLFLFSITFFALLFPSLICSETDEELIKRMDAEDAAYDEYIVYVNELRRSFAEQMRKEFDLHGCGAGGMMHGTIEAIGMQFVAKRRATIDEARALQLLVMEKFVDAVNTDKRIHPFLETKPFTYKQVQVSIDFKGMYGGYTDGSIYYVYNIPEYAAPLNRNHLLYYVKDAFTGDHIKVFRESFEEATKINSMSPVKNPAIHEVTEKEEVIDELLFAFRKKIVKKHRLDCWSLGGKMTGDVEEIGAKFITVRQATQDEARALVLDVAEELLKAVNESEKIKPYLAQSPFPVDRLKLRLCFRKKNYSVYRNGAMESVTLDGGKVTYFREMPKEERKDLGYVPHVQTYGSESYEEALEKNVETKSSPKSFFWRLYDYL